MTYKNIVVGTDGSETANRAVSQAATLAVASSARLIIVTAFEKGDDGSGAEGVPTDMRWMLADRSQAEKLAREAKSTAIGLGAKGVVVQAVDGDPAGALIDVAKEFGADVIVVGSVGLTRSARILLGSVASSVSHHAPCDVLIVDTV